MHHTGRGMASVGTWSFWAGVVPVLIGGFFLPHLDGFCHPPQDNLTQSIPSRANPWRQALQKQKTFPTVSLYSDYFGEIILGMVNWVSHPDIGGF